jgi:hypothetical protein
MVDSKFQGGFGLGGTAVSHPRCAGTRSIHLPGTPRSPSTSAAGFPEALYPLYFRCWRLLCVSHDKLLG